MVEGGVILECAYCDGVAYFKDDAAQSYCVDGCSCVLVRTEEVVRRGTLEQCVLAQPGRRFPSAAHASQYMVAIVLFERLINAATGVSEASNVDDRVLLERFFARAQRHLAASGRSVLETIPAFSGREHYLHATADEIGGHLRAYPFTRPIL